jgi:hypothetical protein
VSEATTYGPMLSRQMQEIVIASRPGTGGTNKPRNVGDTDQRSRCGARL